MTKKSIQRHFAISQSLRDLQKAVTESRIVYEDDHEGALPFCTVNGKRQVISVSDQPGYDLWTPKRKPENYQVMGRTIHNDMSCSAFSCSLEQAIAFLKDAPLHIVKGMKSSNENPKEKRRFNSIWRTVNEVLKETSSVGAVH
jgi:hypothetical protein